MSDQLISSITTIATAIIGVAIIAVLVSQKANTSNVISSAGSAFSNALGTAVSPITGSSSSMGFTGTGAGLNNYF